MKQNYRCGDSAALVGLLYEDCQGGERDMIKAHLAICATCAEEFEALVDTREQLSAWTPPATQLGFRLTSNETTVATRTRWWQGPLPAWAQLAAAAAIFGIGLAVGASRGQSTRLADVVERPVVAGGETETARFEQRLRLLEQRVSQPVVVHPLDGAASDALIARVREELNARDLRWNDDLVEMSRQFTEESDMKQKVTERRMERLNAQLDGLSPTLAFNAPRGNGD